MLVVAVAGMIAVLVTGAEINGARRWLSIGGYSLQPSEFAKPAFVVLLAWLFAESQRAQRHARAADGARALGCARRPARAAARRRPDPADQHVWGALYLLAGLPLASAPASSRSPAAAGCGLPTTTFGHVQHAPRPLLQSAPFENSQVDRAMQSFSRADSSAAGPGEGTIKTVLPDAHTDFIFAVVAEEYGVIACLALLALFAFIVLRALIARRRRAGCARPAVRSRAGAAVRPAGADQHGRQCRPAAAKGHDAAVHLRRRLVDAGAVDHGRHAARSDAAPDPTCSASKSRDWCRLSTLREYDGTTASRMSDEHERDHRSCWRPAEPAATCFRRSRWPRSWRGAASPSISITDMRGDRYGTGFPARASIRCRPRRWPARSPVACRQNRRCAGARHQGGVQASWAGAARAPSSASAAIRRFPPLVAARLRGIPTALHEQNAVLGRANRMLAKRVDGASPRRSSARNFSTATLAAKARFTGNPVRQSVIDARAAALRCRPAPMARSHLLVFGGSQGARYFSDAVPPALGAAAGRHARAPRRRAAGARGGYRARPGGLRAQPASAPRSRRSSPTCPSAMAAAHLVIGRAGASTVAELAVIGRPSILVPLPHALDNDQLQECPPPCRIGRRLVYRAEGSDAGAPCRRNRATAGRRPRPLRRRRRQQKAGRPDAVARLADFVLALAGETSTAERYETRVGSAIRAATAVDEERSTHANARATSARSTSSASAASA